MDDLRQKFPLLVNHPELIYFDNAATTLKPQSVIDAVMNYYVNLSSNIHRGDYKTAVEATRHYDAVRQKVADLIHCDPDCVVYTTGTSESLNLIAQGYGMTHLVKDDVILISEVEHASNVLPWFNVAKKCECTIAYVPLNDDLSFDLDALDQIMQTKPVKIVSLAHISNVLGYVNDIDEIARIVHRNHGILVIDGAQSVGHIPVDVTKNDVDFLVFSSHKMTGPTGVGILYGKKHLLDATEPLFYGGDSNARYYKDGSYTVKDVPLKFETGTPNIEGIIGFGEAVSFIQSLDLEVLMKHVIEMQHYIMDELSKMDHVTVYNPISNTGIVMFNIEGIFPQDVAAYLGHHNICVRAGSHCSKLTCGIFETDSSVRASLYFYNTMDEARKFLEVIQSISLEAVVSLYV